VQIGDGLTAGLLGEHHGQRRGDIQQVGGGHAVYRLADPVTVAIVGVGGRVSPVTDRDQPQRDQLQSRIAASVPPDSPSVVEAGELLAKLGTLWEAATPEEQRDLTRLMVKDVYVDIVEQRITAIEPLPQFSFLLGEVCEGLEVEVL